MGEPQNTRVDLAAVAAVADRFDALAARLDEAGRAARPRFDGATAGQAHGDAGRELRRAVEVLITDVAAWARADAEIAVALRSGAARYRAGDTDAAAGMG